MKWLSIKKYAPLSGGEYFITDGEFIYTATYSLEGWTDTAIDSPIGNVTHFCMPDAVEIEE